VSSVEHRLILVNSRERLALRQRRATIEDVSVDGYGRTPSVSIDDVPVDVAEGVVLLDVREDDEWAQGHAPGALHIPMEDVPARLDEIDMDAELFVICRQGGRSLVVVDYLNQIGFEAVNVAGGMVAWQSRGRPLTADGGGPASVY